MNEPVNQRSPAEASSQALRARILAEHRVEEALALERLRPHATLDAEATRRVASRALTLAERVRETPQGGLSAEAFLRQHGLSSREGVALMCLAEALLRIPDADTADALLQEKLASGDWGRAEGGSLAAHAAEWALMLTGTLARWHELREQDLGAQLKRAVSRLGEPVVRGAVRQAMHILAEQFVLAPDIGEAIEQSNAHPGWRYSFDMLGEAARTREDAQRYFDAYADAVRAVSARSAAGAPQERDSISVKLSALHPRFEPAQHRRMRDELLPRLTKLARLAREGGIGLTIDAEESDRLELTLELFEPLARDPMLADWGGLGIVVQAYQKRAFALCEWLIALAREARRRLAVRLVKGAYWDTEIKHAQQLGVADYPVFTRKAATDVSYLACARLLLAARGEIYPAFATHNCRTAASVLELAGERAELLEFQRLHGMGEALHAALADSQGVASRVYAPVGGFAELLPYLVRRLLENGANTSFVHQITDPAVPLATLIADPLLALPEPYLPDERIPAPPALYPDRANALGVDLARRDELERLAARTRADRAAAASTHPATGETVVREPGDLERHVGAVRQTGDVSLNEAIGAACEEFERWSPRPADERAGALERAADAFESHLPELVSLIVREGGRTYADAVSEVREAVDFCRYYALQAREKFARPQILPGPTGERNVLALHGRGVFACISPWNFPLAIFTGQVAAALAAGNTVIAKPAEQTPLVARMALELLHGAGIPRHAAMGVYGDGENVGARLIADERIAGVAFTGSFETAKRIQRTLAERDGPIVPLIAETGGINAMLADSSALAEQLIDDVITSAFRSAGQRCSALRVLFIDQAVAPRVLAMLAGAMRELRVGDPVATDTDVGPIIDRQARAALEEYVAGLRGRARLIGETPLPERLPEGHYFAPRAFEISLADMPQREVFGPVLHVIAYRRQALDAVLAAIRGGGYGLTLGVHSRVQGFAERVIALARVGNAYVNRSMIGAVVGVQPFGGEGRSGTGFKAGGPHYLLRFATERSQSVNTAAIGGNTELLAPRARR